MRTLGEPASRGRPLLGLNQEIHTLVVKRQDAALARIAQGDWQDDFAKGDAGTRKSGQIGIGEAGSEASQKALHFGDPVAMR